MNQYQEKTLHEAIRYARRGWYIFPCNWDKTPRTKNGFYDATTDEQQITSWWVEMPDSLIGIRTGKESGFWVVDIDVKHGKNGLDSIGKHFGFTDEDIKEWNGNLMQQTASGGVHLLFEYDEANPIGCGVDHLPGVDIRGDGGYIIAAPSSVKVGDEFKQYKWNDLNKPIPKAPQWATELVNLKSSNKKKVDLDDAITQGVPEGIRDDSLFKIACMLEREGVELDTAGAFLECVADKCTPPFDKQIAREKVTRVYTDYATSQGIERRLAAMKERSNVN